MAYQALYRKYRPLDFTNVVGQEAVVKTLKNALENSKTSHAYMFSGPRGTGKTTIAKILAKTINCLDPHDGICCGKCKNCLSIASNECTDIIEIDAASNNGVDEIREIRNKINLVPSELKYKVYIIDEVHMLSIGAFNALLKTLEEPPEHVVFILATTDPHKVPITIISRCQCFEFKRISDAEIIDRLAYVCKQENIEIEEAVLQKIAKISEGGMRDALGILDKAASYCNDKITLSDFNQINGLVDYEYKEQFLDFIYQKDVVQLLQKIDDLYQSGKDLIVFIQDIMELLRDKMIRFYTKKEESYPINFIISLIHELNQLLVDCKNVNSVKVLLETSLLGFINGTVDSKKETDSPVTHVPKVVPLISTPSQKVDVVQPVKSEKVEVKKEEEKSIANPEKVVSKEAEEDPKWLENYFRVCDAVVNNTFASAKKEYLLFIKEKFQQLNDFVLDRSYGAAACYLIDSQVRAAGEQFMIVTCNYESILERGTKLLYVMEELIEKITGHRYKIAIITNQMWEEEKKKFIARKNSGEKYELREVPEMILPNVTTTEVENSSSDDIVHQAIALFGEDIVKIQ